MRNRVRRGVQAGLALLLAVGLSACASAAAPAPAPPPAPPPQKLTLGAAGQRYLATICPVNVAWQQLAVEIDRLRVASGRATAVDTSAYRGKVQQVEAATVQAAKAFADPALRWPDAVGATVENLRVALQKDADELQKVADFTPAQVAAYQWGGSPNTASLAATLRAALGISGDPLATCQQLADSGN